MHPYEAFLWEAVPDIPPPTAKFSYPVTRPMAPWTCIYCCQSENVRSLRTLAWFHSLLKSLNSTPCPGPRCWGQKAETRGSKTCFLLPHLPFCSFQVIVCLLQLSDVFLQLIFNCLCLSEVILQGRDLPVAFRMLRLKLLLKGKTDRERPIEAF